MKRKVNHFTDDFKFQVIQEYLNTDIKRYLCDFLNIIFYFFLKAKDPNKIIKIVAATYKVTD
ncbi:MAG: hypothetical protein Q8O30_12480 [Candidatus Omnitrophota bacterium]|nr:hypothetical protein [Candidatus Omnitrophota bacterium]